MKQGTAAAAFVLSATVFTTFGALAQKVDSIQPWEVGDKKSFQWTLGSKVLRVDEEAVEVTDQEVRISSRTPERAYETTVDRASFALSASVCLANGQQCTFSPPLNALSLPLTKGRKWSTSFTVTGETFSADVTQDRVVEKMERIKVPGGEFDAYRIAFTGRIKGKDAKGAAFSGKEEGTDWFAVTASGKPFVVKTVYRNSFGEKTSSELLSMAFK